MCVTCGKVYPTRGRNCLQAGHFVPGRKNAYLFDERQVNAQCYNCNYNLKGNWPPYYEVMVSRYGQEAVDDIVYRQRNQVVQFTSYELEEMIELYKRKIEELPNGLETEYPTQNIKKNLFRETSL